MPALNAADIIAKTLIDRLLKDLSGEPKRRGLMPDLRDRSESPGLASYLPEITNRELPDLHDLDDETSSLAPNLEDDEDFTGVKIEPYDREQIKNIGIDVRLGDEVWISDTIVGRSEDLSLISLKKHRIKDSFICEPDARGRKIYYFLTHERIKLSSDLEFKVDSKSTTGRVGCMSHQVVSNGDSFDGRILIALQPYAFPIEVVPGKTSTSQVIFRYKGTPLMDQDKIKEAWERQEVCFHIKDQMSCFPIEYDQVPLSKALKPGGLEMTFSTHMAYRAKRDCPPLDLTKRNYYDPDDFFEVIGGNDALELEPDRFYLLGTRERVSLRAICGELTREHSDVGTGLWSHFAGFFMPGYNGEITLECITTTKRIISQGSPAGLVTLDRVRTQNEIKFEGAYQNQKAPRLPKIFKYS